MSDRKIIEFPHCDNFLSSTDSSTTTTTTTITTGEVCEDIWPTKKCQRRKNKGKCNKNWVAKNCQLTCELCEGGSGEEQCQDNWSAAKCQKKLNQDKCERDWVAKNCLFTCGYCNDKWSVK